MVHRIRESELILNFQHHTANSLSSCHTLLVAETGRISYNLSTEFMLSDHILYSHDFSDRECFDITERNLTLITVGA